MKVELLYCRLYLAIIFILVLPLTVLADGYGFSQGFLPMLWETNQTAVINLTESTADVSMFIAIEGIPPGKEITYVLPFWYQPDGFSMTEEDDSAFQVSCVFPATMKVMRMHRMATHHGSSALLDVAPCVSVGIPALFFKPFFNGAREKGYGGAPMLTPYATSKTPHARAELYHIGEHDLQRLIQQSGLPAKYLKTLAKYRTPYFAVMRLKGLTSAEKMSDVIQYGGVSAQGICYHFTHRITAGRYTYPLGTGAAWPQPIPLTEVYITCPDRLAMHITAPVEGEKLDWMSFDMQANQLTDDLSESPTDRNDLPAPCTASMLDANVKRPSAWHIAYLQSNPAEDINVQLSKQFLPWRFALVDFFMDSDGSLIISIILYLLCWFATTWFIMRRKWQQAGSPGNLFVHGLHTFFVVQGIVGIAACSGIINLIYVTAYRTADTDWVRRVMYALGESFPLSNNMMGAISVIFAILLFLLLIVLSIRLIKFSLLYDRKTTIDRRKRVTLASWLCPAIPYAVLAMILYNNSSLLSYALQPFPRMTVIIGSLTVAIVSIILFVLLVSLSRRLIIYAVSSDLKEPANWYKGLTVPCWLCSSLLFAIMAAMLYSVLYWCEIV